MVHPHTVHLALGALLSPCTMCGYRCESLIEVQPSEKATVTQMLERETRRERNLEVPAIDPAAYIHISMHVIGGAALPSWQVRARELRAKEKRLKEESSREVVDSKAAWEDKIQGIEDAFWATVQKEDLGLPGGAFAP